MNIYVQVHIHLEIAGASLNMRIRDTQWNTKTCVSKHANEYMYEQMKKRNDNMYSYSGLIKKKRNAHVCKMLAFKPRPAEIKKQTTVLYITRNSKAPGSDGVQKSKVPICKVDHCMCVCVSRCTHT